MSNPGHMLARRIGGPGLARALGRMRRRSILLGRYPHIVSLLILFVPLLLIAVIGKMARIESQYFSVLEIADFLRSEIFFITAVLFLWSGAILVTRSGFWRWIHVAAASLLWLIICVTEVLGTGYQLTTGDNGFTYPLLVYSIKKLPELAPLVSAEMSKAIIPFSVLALLSGLLLWSLIYLYRRTGGRQRVRHGHRPELGKILIALSPAALIVAGLPGYYSNDLLASRSMTVNAVLDAIDLLIGEPRADPIRDTFPTAARLVPAGDAPPANLAIIILESTRAQAVTVYNPDLATTPFLDELAKSSMVAENAYTLVPQTSKALVAILCGLESYLRRAVREARPDRGVPGKCLARLLRDIGYRTAYFQSATGTFELRHGLVRNFGYETFISGDEMDAAGFEKANYFGFEDNIMLGPSRQWLEDASGKPFFVTYLTNTPHHPYLAPKRYGSHDFAADEEFNRYLNSVHYLDHFVAELIGQYKDLGLYDNTVFIILGDHGEGFGEHGRKQHITTIYDEGVHIPFLVHDGRAPEGARVGHPVSVLDVLPTAAAMLGLEIEDGEYPGWSITVRPDDAPVMVHCWRERQCMAMIEGDFKLVNHFGNRPDELFNLRLDEAERNDITADFPQLSALMGERLKAWRAGVRAYYRAYYRIMKAR